MEIIDMIGYDIHATWPGLQTYIQQQPNWRIFEQSNNIPIKITARSTTTNNLGAIIIENTSARYESDKVFTTNGYDIYVDLPTIQAFFREVLQV